MLSGITLYSNFSEDRRFSMDFYAEQLQRALEKELRESEPGPGVPVVRFQPRIPPWCSFLGDWRNVRMRCARYLSYPYQVRRVAGSGVHHIVDHGYAHLVASLTRAHSVVTVHDLIPILGWAGHIKGFRYPHRPRMLEFSLKHLNHVGRVITVSHNSKRDLVDLLGLAPERISVVPNGLNEVFRPLAMSKKELRSRLGLPELGFMILTSGPDGACKNHERSLEVLLRLQKLIDEPVFMVRYGDFTHGRRSADLWQQRVERMGLASDTYATGVVSDETLVELFNAADCLLFPSLYEGFGWPPLESMACGTPVVTSNAASLPEVVGEAALMADPNDTDGLTEAVLRVYDDEAVRMELVTRGFEHSQRYTWKKTARRMLEIYCEVVD